MAYQDYSTSIISTFILIYSLRDNKDFVAILKNYLLVYLLASLIIILQSFICGPIEWLGQPSHRVAIEDTPQLLVL